MPRPLLAAAALAIVSTLGLTACAGAGSSDVAGEPDHGGGASAATTVSLFAYAVPKVAFDKLVPGFQRTPAGRGVEFQQSYGASGDQSRKVAAGAEADVVSFSVEPDVTRLVEAGLVDPSWRSGARRGVPFGSVVTLVVRDGNPKGITDWDDLLRPGVEVVTPNPFSSGSAKWNLLAPYAAKSEGGTNKAAGLAFIEALVRDHVRIQPKSGREATEAFLQGSGDVLLSYENEALFIERNGDPVEHVTPPSTFRIENPAAVLRGNTSSRSSEAADAFNEYLYTAEAQELVAEAGFRPVDPSIAAKHASTFPPPRKLWTIADLGGWPAVDASLFTKDVGDLARIYEAATL